MLAYVKAGMNESGILVLKIQGAPNPPKISLYERSCLKPTIK